MTTNRTERILIPLTTLALNCPSGFTIAWSKQEHKEDLPILYAGLGVSGVTIAGALLDNDKLMYGGLVLSLILFAYVVFVYQGKEGEWE